MKISVPPKQRQDPFEWHDIFAFLPHSMTETGEWVWLETIQRRWCTYSSSDLSATREYRLNLKSEEKDSKQLADKK